MKASARSALRVLLSSHVTNGLSAGAGLLLVSTLVHLLLGPAASAAAVVGVIVVTPPDQPAPRHGKYTHLLPAALIGTPLFLAVHLVHERPLALWLLLVGATFIAFLGAAWGKRGLPIAISAMFAMIFSLAAPAAGGLDAALLQTAHFALGAFLYLLWATAANALLNARYRTLAVVDTLLAVASLMRTQAAQLAAPGADAAKAAVGRLMKQQAALADQLQSARNLLLESPSTPARQRLAGMLMQILDMRDHLVACALDLESLAAVPEQHPLLRGLSVELDGLAGDLEAMAEALLLGRQPAPFTRQRPPLPAVPAVDAAPAAGEPQPAPPHLLARSMAGRVGHVHEEVARLVALARCEREPDLDVVRVAWQLFVSPTVWSWRPFLTMWRWDAPPLRHAIRAALAMGCGQALAMVLPWGSHEYWILLTIVVVLRGSLAQTLERRNARVAGTLLGSVLAGALLSADLPASVLMLVVVAGQSVAHAFAIRRYLVTAVAATVLSLVQAHLLGASASPVFDVAERMADTAIGVLIAWVFSYVLPSWERTQVAALVARTLSAQAKHARLALGLGQLEAVDNQAELSWRLARREAYDSLSALVQAIQRALSEPRAVQPRLQDLERLLGHGYQLLAQLTAIKTMLLQRRDRLAIEQLREPLQQGAEAIASALAGATHTAPVRSDDDPAPMLQMPDPYVDDLSPWLLRRLRLAVVIAHDLEAEARRAVQPGNDSPR
ncbi:MAG: FUSC family membrane protein [Ramlibacter sp.]